ncbi:MAG: helix-turn-helix domain-containing protein [Parabacteroides distasonis]
MNQPVSREKLFQEIWDGQEAHDSLNNSISRLRKLLERDTTLSIDAVKGVGYILSKKDLFPSSQLREAYCRFLYTLLFPIA